MMPMSHFTVSAYHDFSMIDLGQAQGGRDDSITTQEAQPLPRPPTPSDKRWLTQWNDQRDQRISHGKPARGPVYPPPQDGERTDSKTSPRKDGHRGEGVQLSPVSPSGLSGGSSL
jgi:hypothetical protein